MDLPQPTRQQTTKDLARRIKRGEFFTVLVKFKRQGALPRSVGFLDQDDLFEFPPARVRALKSSAGAVQEKTFKSLRKEGRDLLLRDFGKKAADTFAVQSSWLGNFIVVPASERILRRVAEDPDVVSITENRMHRIPAPVKADVQKVLRRETSASATWGVDRIGAARIWKQLKLTGKGVSIGHLDTGADPEHPDLSGKIQRHAFFDQFGRKIDVRPYFDTDYHGTHTAGTIVGDSASGVAIGVAPGASLYSAIVLPNGSGTTAQIVGGMEWLMEQGVRVMNLSLGGAGYDAGFDEIIQEVAGANIFPAISIGNEGLGVTGSPGNVLGAVGIGAVNIDEEVSEFSGGGTLTWYDNVGNKQHIEKPELVAPGEGILSSIPLEYGQPYLKLSGTSMAAPHVAGLAALMVQKKKSATFPELLRAMQKTAKHLSSTGSANRSGFGLIQGFEAVQAV